MLDGGGRSDTLRLMSLHLIKLCVGVSEVEELRAWQAKRVKQSGVIWHRTRMRPKRADEILDGGSLYWVIRGVLQCRQQILDLKTEPDADGINYTYIILGHDIVSVEPRPHRAFQGWRYLQEKDAPADLEEGQGDGANLPPAMLAELRQLGIL